MVFLGSKRVTQKWEEPGEALHYPQKDPKVNPCGVLTGPHSRAKTVPSPAYKHCVPFCGSLKVCLGERPSQRVHFCCYSCSFSRPTLSLQCFSNHSLAVNTRDFLPVLTTVALVVTPLSGIARQEASHLRASERRGEEGCRSFMAQKGLWVPTAWMRRVESSWTNYRE